MRAVAYVLLPVGLAIAVAGISAAGRQIAGKGAPATIAIDPIEDILPDETDEPPVVGPTPAGPVLAANPSRNVAPTVVTPPPVGDVVEREAPRPPLSRLSLALPPKADLAKGSKLFRPVAVELAVVEAKGLRVAIAGTVSVPPDEACIHDGASWPCGVNARTAFRLWLRGRTLDCAMPDTAERNLIVASCMLGKQDAGAWLVANGWARAAAGGPYAELESAARNGGKGIFGPPPDTGGLPSIPALPDTAASIQDQPILAMPPADLQEPDE